MMGRRKLIWSSFYIMIVVLIAEYNAQSAYGSVVSHEGEHTPKIYRKFTFAGEFFPYENKEHYNRYLRYEGQILKINKETAYMIKKSKRIFKVIEPILKKHGIPDDFKYLAVSESNLNKKSVSMANAVGVWQLMSYTAVELGLEVNDQVDERLNLVKSTEAICKLLKRDREYFKSWTEALVAFNMGNTALYRFQKAQNNYDDIYSLKMYKESAHVIYKILAYKELFSNLDKYGYGDVKGEKIKFKKITVKESIDNLKTFAEHHNYDYGLLREYNSWILGNSLAIGTKKAYTLQIAY